MRWTLRCFRSSRERTGRSREQAGSPPPNPHDEWTRACGVCDVARRALTGPDRPGALRRRGGALFEALFGSHAACVRDGTDGAPSDRTSGRGSPRPPFASSRFEHPAREIRADRTWQPEDVIRRALKRAGIVIGYTHVCRRKSCGYSEERSTPSPNEDLKQAGGAEGGFEAGHDGHAPPACRNRRNSSWFQGSLRGPRTWRPKESSSLFNSESGDVLSVNRQTYSCQ